MKTDDPDTPGKGGWEVNISNDIERTAHGLAMDSPRFDINYGLLENDQWKIEAPISYASTSDRGGQWGIGDLLLGWKYRFFDKHGLRASVYPQLLTPTGNEQAGLGEGQTQLLVPIEIGAHLCNDKLFIYAEGGYNIAFGDRALDYWKYGLAAEWQRTKKMQWLCEVGALLFCGGGAPDNTFFDAGFHYAWTDNVAMIASFGRGFLPSDRGTPDFQSYVGLQWTFGGSKKAAEPEQ